MKNTIKKLLKLLPIGISKNHQYDLDTRKILKLNLRSNSNCIDIGCHEGEILDYFIKYAPQGSHYGFEPIPRLYKGLCTKYANMATIYPYALSESKGTTTFHYVASNPAYSGIKRRDYDRPNERVELIEVEQCPLDDLIIDIPKIDLIKIDVEGAEYQVLAGSQKLLSRDKPIIIFEHGKGASEHYGTTPEKLYDYLQGLKYQIYNLSSFLKKQKSLNRDEFIQQYEQRKHYYFVAK